MINTNINTKIKKFFNIEEGSGCVGENNKIDLDEIKAEVSFLRSKRIYIWQDKGEVLMYDSDSKTSSTSIEKIIKLANQEGFVQQDNEPIESLPKKAGIKKTLQSLRQNLPKKKGTFENNDNKDLMTSIDNITLEYTNIIAKNQLKSIKQKLQSGKIDQSIAKSEIVELLVATNGYRLPDKAFGILLNGLNNNDLSLDSVKSAINNLPDNIPKKHPLKNKLLNGIIQLRPKNPFTGYGAELVKNSYNTLTTLGYNLPVKALNTIGIVNRGGDGIKLIAETGLNAITKTTELLTKNLSPSTKENLKNNPNSIKLQNALNNLRQFLSRSTNAPQLSQMEVIPPDIGAMRTNKEVVFQSLTTLGMATAQAVFLINSLTLGIEISGNISNVAGRAGDTYVRASNSQLGKSTEGNRLIEKKASQIVSSKAEKIVGKIVNKFDGVGNVIDTLFVKGNNPIRATETLVELFKTGEVKTPEAIEEKDNLSKFLNRPVVQTSFEKQEYNLGQINIKRESEGLYPINSVEVDRQSMEETRTLKHTTEFEKAIEYVNSKSSIPATVRELNGRKYDRITRAREIVQSFANNPEWAKLYDEFQSNQVANNPSAFIKDLQGLSRRSKEFRQSFGNNN